MSKLNRKNLKSFFIILSIVVMITAVVLVIFKKNVNTKLTNYDNELLRTMSYAQFLDGDENVENTDNVKFSTFFLRDLDGDGYAEKIKGTCKRINSQDTLYMEIIVQTEGYLKDAKIQINGNNFYLQTSLPKDNELKANYIGNDIKQIEFEELANGTQKLLTGIVKNKIGTNINNYSRTDNTIVLTGTYVTGDGTEIPITKQITLATDWYGETEAGIRSNMITQNRYDLPDRIDEENESITLNFEIVTDERKNELNISSNYVEAVIPQLNGYNPTSVTLISGTGDTTYDEETRKFTITKNAETDVNGNITTSISRSSSNRIEVVYPIEAYTSLENDVVSIKIPVSTYYEGYNNPNREFQNPYKSNVAEATIVSNYSNPKGTVANLDITVGRYVSNPTWHYMISKRKPLRLYNEISSEEKDDFYTVRWEAFTGSDGESDGLLLKETKNTETQKTDTFIKANSTEYSMENVTTNVGIYFTNADAILGTEGEIRVINEDTDELVHTFTSSEWNNYNSNNPYKYENSIKHIRIETSATSANSSLYVYNIKELDDDQIVDSYAKEEFDTLQYIKSNLTMYLGDLYIGSKTHQAHYEAPYSLARISLSKNTVSTQDTTKGLNIEISTSANEADNQEKWTNGTFLVKIPDEIIDLKINEVLINDLLVNLDSSEIIENSSGKFIKIKTSNVNPSTYSITINVDITPDPRIATVTKNFELYAINEGADEYYYTSADKYDVDEDGNKTEIVNYRTTSISLVAPNSMLTNQMLTDLETGTIVISPAVGDLKPVYGNNDLEKQKVKIGAQLKNNYSSTISEVIMVGKIPYEGNTYVVSGGNLKSEFSTTMTNAGITIPEALQGKVTVYYSENENPTKNISDSTNGWTLAENVSDWTRIKTWAVDFEDTVLNKGDEYTFYYTVEVPFGVDLNKETFSHHGIFFCLNTPEGKYRTQTEPNKVGIKIADKYDLQLTKYQKNTNKLVPGATYRLSKLDEQGNIVYSQTAKTNAEGKLGMTNLYAENVYEIKEIQTPDDYELNDDIIKFIGHVDRETGQLSIEKIVGTTKEDIQVIKNAGEDYQVVVKVEDEARAKLKIVKYEQGTNTLVSGSKYTITGEGLPDTGKTIKTNANGEAEITGLNIGKEYTLQETNSTEGYYLNPDVIKFTINNNNGTYEINVSEGTPKSTSILQENDLPKATITVEDEKIPTYDLEILKVSKGEHTPLQGIKFNLYKAKKIVGTYETDANGKILITGLYQFEDAKNIDQTYVLKESGTIDGYSKVKDIEFSTKMVENVLVLTSESNAIVENTGTATRVNITVENPKTFELTKVDGETGDLLPNAKFAIFNIAEGEGSKEIPAVDTKGRIVGTPIEIDGKQYYYVETDSNGKITANLPAGVYKAVEIEASNDKYDISRKSLNTMYFGIGETKNTSKILEEDLLNIHEYNRASVTSPYNAKAIFVEDGVIAMYGNSSASYLVKFDENNELVWERKVYTGGYSLLYDIARAEDGGIIAVGDFDSGITIPGEETASGEPITIDNYKGALVLKYNLEGKLEWYRNIVGGSDSYNHDVYVSPEDGDIFVCGKQPGSSNFVSGITCTGTGDGFVVKYDKYGAPIFGTRVQERAWGVYEKDGYVYVGGENGAIYKLSETGNLLISKTGTGKINSITNIDSGILVAQGSNINVYDENLNITQTITLEAEIRYAYVDLSGYINALLNNGKVIVYDRNSNSVIMNKLVFSCATLIDEDGFGRMIISGSKSGKTNYVITGETNVPEQSEVLFNNYRKEYKITTDVHEIDNIKGGSISGEDQSPYEVVKHGDTSANSIIMTPDSNYEIIGITVNGKEYPYTPLPDDSYQMPQFENMTEDKHIVVTYAKKDNKITINKVDKDTREPIPGIEFRLDQIEERNNPVNSEIIGDLTENGTTYYTIDTNNEVTSTTLGQLTANGEHYFVEKEGTLVPTNSKTYQTENGLGTEGIPNSTANSYMKIDLTNLQGNYAVVVNARVSSEGADKGYATITDNTTAPAYNNETGRFMYISGTIANTDYQSLPLTGGNTYYIHLGYRKDSSIDTNEDQVVINSVKVYQVNVERYNFIDNNGVYESTNAGKDNRVCNSYVPIDLTNYTGKYNITVNAEISTRNGDYGYVTINKTQTAPSYSYTTGRIVYITSNQSAKNYTYEIDGGYLYYLHLGYYKDSTTNTSGNDIFKVNNIEITLSDSQLYHTSVTTNSEGQAITQIPFGKYNVTELNTPAGYKAIEQPIEIEFRGTDGAQHEFTVENEKKAKLIVHHYIKGTETKLADDEEYYGDIDEDYTTSPRLDIEKYSLEKDNNDEYVLPNNAAGQYREQDTIVTYYYVPMPAMIRVNHFIEGTENPVPLSDGSNAPQEIKNGEIGDNYTTEAITPENLDPRYELVEIPENSTGRFTDDEIVVNYYYKIKKYKITTDVEEYDQTNILGETEHIRGGDILGEDEKPYEVVKHSENSVKDIIVTPESGYEVKQLTINNNPVAFAPGADGRVAVDKFVNMTEDKHIVVRLGKKLSQVLVHHYIEGTETRVPSIYGGEVQDQTTTGPIGNPYMTNPTDENTPRYELVDIPLNASGYYAENLTEVIYYYREVPAKVLVNHYIVNTTTPVPLQGGGTATQETINGYVTKPYETNRLTNVSEQYVYVSDTGNTTGEMTRDTITVNYYYRAKAYAKVNYIAINSDNTETLLDTTDYQGLDEEEYTAHSRDFDGYELVRRPDVETKNLDKDQITVFNYYYRKNTGLLEKHIDLYTDEILFNDSQDGNVGDEYQIDSKTFDGYVIATNKKYYEKQIKDNPSILTDNNVTTLEALLEKLNLEPDEPYIPDNYKGNMREETIEVKYYYMKKAKVIVKYKDKITDEPIHPDTPIDGYEKDPYKTDPENIDDYDLTEDPEYTPTNTEGEMTPETIIVTYYYENKTEVKVNHIYILDDTLIDSGRTEGHVKDLYKTDQLDNEKYPNYRIVTNKEYYEYAVKKDSTILADNDVETVDELLAKLKLSEYDPYIPSNYKGEMTKDTIIVNYYYKKQAPIIVKHIDEETGKELTEPEEEIKDVGDPYNTEPNTFEKYEVVEEKLPENAKGIIDDDGEEVIYYYRKIKKPIIPEINTDESSESVESPPTGDTTMTITLSLVLVLIVLNLLEKANMRKKGTKPKNIIK